VWDNTKNEIGLELQQMHTLLEYYRPLLIKVRSTTPDNFEVNALGALLQSFYNGAENIFKRIALELDHESPRGESWHSDLLEAMAKPGANRPALISASLEDRLWPYLQFRHLFRSAYSFLLQWEKMAPLVQDCESTLAALEAEWNTFLSKQA
jgi:hypothetical protein